MRARMPGTVHGRDRVVGSPAANDRGHRQGHFDGYEIDWRTDFVTRGCEQYAAKGQATSKQIASRNMGEWHWLLAVSETHQLAGTGQTSLAEIAEESLAIYAEADGRSDVSSMTTTLPSLSPRRIYRSSHIMSLMTYVSSGLGVAFVPAPIPSLSFPGVAFVAIKDPLPKLQMELLWSVDGASAAVVNYLNCAEEAKEPAYR